MYLQNRVANIVKDDRGQKVGIELNAFMSQIDHDKQVKFFKALAVPFTSDFSTNDKLVYAMLCVVSPNNLRLVGKANFSQRIGLLNDLPNDSASISSFPAVSDEPSSQNAVKNHTPPDGTPLGALYVVGTRTTLKELFDAAKAAFKAADLAWDNTTVRGWFITLLAGACAIKQEIDAAYYGSNKMKVRFAIGQQVLTRTIVIGQSNPALCVNARCNKMLLRCLPNKQLGAIPLLIKKRDGGHEWDKNVGLKNALTERGLDHFDVPFDTDNAAHNAENLKEIEEAIDASGVKPVVLVYPLPHQYLALGELLDNVVRFTDGNCLVGYDNLVSTTSARDHSQVKVLALMTQSGAIYGDMRIYMDCSPDIKDMLNESLLYRKNIDTMNKAQKQTFPIYLGMSEQDCFFYTQSAKFERGRAGVGQTKTIGPFRNVDVVEAQRYVTPNDGAGTVKKVYFDEKGIMMIRNHVWTPRGEQVLFRSRDGKSANNDFSRGNAKATTAVLSTQLGPRKIELDQSGDISSRKRTVDFEEPTADDSVSQKSGYTEDDERSNTTQHTVDPMETIPPNQADWDNLPPAGSSTGSRGRGRGGFGFLPTEGRVTRSQTGTMPVKKRNRDQLGSMDDEDETTGRKLNTNAFRTNAEFKQRVEVLADEALSVIHKARLSALRFIANKSKTNPKKFMAHFMTEREEAYVRRIMVAYQGINFWVGSKEWVLAREDALAIFDPHFNDEITDSDRNVQMLWNTLKYKQFTIMARNHGLDEETYRDIWDRGVKGHLIDPTTLLFEGFPT